MILIDFLLVMKRRRLPGLGAVFALMIARWITRYAYWATLPQYGWRCVHRPYSRRELWYAV